MKGDDNLETFSVAVITYNQEDFILETLNSVYNQDHDNIELVISDDGSTDKTCEKVAAWLNKFSKRFSRAIIVRSDENQGVVYNMFRAIRETKSQYIKIIAGDDILATDAISKAYIIFKENEDWLLFSGEHIDFKFSEKQSKYIIVGKGQKFSEKQFFSMNPKEQFRRLCNHSPIVAPSVFYRRAFFDIIKLDNYDFKVIEDKPLWLLATLKGIKIPYCKGPKVFRRIHSKSLSGSYSTSSLIEKRFRILYFSDQRRYIDEIIKINEHLLGTREKKYLDLIERRLDEIENNNYRIKKRTKVKQIYGYLYAPYMFLDEFTRIYNKLVCSLNGYKRDSRKLTEALKEPKKA